MEAKPAVNRLHDAVDTCLFRPDVILLTMQDWWGYYRSLDKEIRTSYEDKGFYRVPSRRYDILSREPSDPSVKAVTFRGVPVVIDEEYQAMMKGRRSNRKVLGV